MNIIFGDSLNIIPDHYTVLELDTFRHPGKSETNTAYCLIEKLAIDEYSNLEHYKTLHADVIKYYKQRYWDYCEKAIGGLMGRWGGELDSFYEDLLKRVVGYKESEPPEDWDGTRVKLDI
jgi:hypothetical protein